MNPKTGEIRHFPSLLAAIAAGFTIPLSAQEAYELRSTDPVDRMDALPRVRASSRQENHARSGKRRFEKMRNAAAAAR